MLQVLRRWLERLAAAEPERRRGCLACGNCCEFFGGNLRASAHDLEKWREAGRNDLLTRVNRLGWIWIDPETGRMLGYCPFLVRSSPQNAICSIHDIKPDMCRAYPTLAHGRRCLRGEFLHVLVPGVAVTPLEACTLAYTSETAPLLLDFLPLM